MKYLRILRIAAMIYSWPPVSNVCRDEESKATVLFLLPLFGIIEGGFLYDIACFLPLGRISAPLSVFLMTVVPLLFTGGIHLSSFLDTVDMFDFWKGKVEKFATSKDVHAGLTAVLQDGSLLLSVFVFWETVLSNEAAVRLPPWALYDFLLSRALNAFSIFVLPSTRGVSAVYNFTAEKQRQRGSGISFLHLLLGSGLLVLIGAWLTGFLTLTAVLIAVLYGVYRARLSFDGMIRDLAGFLLTSCKAAAMFAAVCISCLNSL